MSNIDGKKQVYSNLDNFFLVITLLLITSPSFSLLKGLGFTDFYFPNEKIAAVLCAAFLIREINPRKYFWNNKWAILSSIGVLLLLLIRFSVFGFVAKDLNLPFSMISLVVYLKYFEVFEPPLKKAILYVFIVHTMVALLQLVFVFMGLEDFAMLFHNHPMQSNYFFSYRVSGLFMESSQFASFLVLSLVVLKNKVKGYELPILIVGFIVFLSNLSITAYAIFFIWMLLEIKKTKIFFVVFLVMLSLDYFLIGLSTETINLLFNKIYLTFFNYHEAIGETRFLEAKRALDVVFSSFKTLFIGVDVRNLEGTGDLVSYNIYRYGIIGFFLIISFYLSIIKFYTRYLLLIIPILLTCAPLMQPVQMYFWIVLSSSLVLDSKVFSEGFHD